MSSIIVPVQFELSNIGWNMNNSDSLHIFWCHWTKTNFSCLLVRTYFFVLLMKIVYLVRFCLVCVRFAPSSALNGPSTFFRMSFQMVWSICFTLYENNINNLDERRMPSNGRSGCNSTYYIFDGPLFECSSLKYNSFLAQLISWM